MPELGRCSTLRLDTSNASRFAPATAESLKSPKLRLSPGRSSDNDDRVIGLIAE